ncbi:hypothetical protein [uncultured Psychroserpens sp.]|uniref:hypothetical protein n=1 Tax=uncultured Psychroserpens sp. TaxID=255436 RepID=UPI002623F326|nr:hypothetical protein [uncultured Psychroserpens sp.]
MKSISLLVLCVLLFNCNERQSSETNEVDLEKPPQITYKEGAVTPFAPSIFSQFINVRDFTIDPEENEAYFTLLSPARELSVVMHIQKENDTWNDPKIASFSGQYTDLEPFLSPDGLKLYFASNRPVSKDSTSVKDFDIWYVQRDQLDLEWSQPINLGAPVNSALDEFYPSVTSSNNIYFTTVKKELESQDDIFMCEWKNGVYSEPVVLGEGVNTKGAEYNAFVAPDESYILFGGWRRPDGLGSGDIYMSKRENGVWQTATNLGETINSKDMEYCPFVNTKTGTLYLTSRRNNVEKKESGYTDTEELLNQINRYDNGASRIYKVDFKTIIENK